MKRPGLMVPNVSSRVNVTKPAAASAFFETKSRPVVVAAHNVPVSLGARSIAATFPPDRLPSDEAVRLVAPLGPIRTKSPQAGFAAEVVNSGQFASRNVWSPPQSCVRQTLFEPWNMVPAFAGFGSAVTGG